ncbi:DUF1127 domain-containing protein [Aquibium sp. LZ166]|uniref:DUF1127 domain-containing protein n=1 Tax=Aquibium pacificus TaxID=3153579 RepID=A0ABV3SJ47_9HYPH
MMNTIMNTYQQFAASPATISTANAILAGARMVQRCVRLHNDRAHLNELPDHMLRDIGITRSEIMSITSFHGRDASRRSRT